MTETWLTPSDTSSAISDITPAGYTFHHLPRRNKGDGGVGIVIKKLISHELIKLPCVTTFEAIAVAIRHCELVFNVACVYRPPTPSTAKLLEEFSSFIEFFSSRPSETIFCGDFNIHMDQKNCLSIDFGQLLDSANLCQLISLPTSMDIFLICS